MLKREIRRKGERRPRKPEEDVGADEEIDPLLASGVSGGRGQTCAGPVAAAAAVAVAAPFTPTRRVQSEVNYTS